MTVVVCSIDTTEPEVSWNRLQNARTFDDDNAAFAWGEDGYEGWRLGLSNSEQLALLKYQNAPVINDPLRGLSELTDPDDIAQIAHMDAALADAIIPEDIQVWRLVEKDAVGPLFPGMVFRDDGFTSTSLLKDVIDDFEMGSPVANYRFRIFVPEGYNGGYLGEGFDEFFAEQQEIVLRRGTAFRVRGINHQTGIVDLEVVP
jgi:hypothetical protein